MALKPCKILNQRTGEIIASRAWIASDFMSRSTGLLNRSSLESDEALLIVPCNSIHMFFMKFPIDVIYLDKNYKIVRLVNDLAPWRLDSCHFKAYMTLETSAGKIAKSDIKLGDLLKIV